MSLLTAYNLARSYGQLDLFTGISLAIPKGARIALVGPNGIGKTTLLRLLVGLEEPNAGVIQRARNLKVGYLPQEAGLDGDHTLWEECLAALADLRALESELSRLEADLAAGSPSPVSSSPSPPISVSPPLLERYGQLQAEFEQRGGYTYETRMRQTLSGLGFTPDDFHRPIPQLSGGQRTRALLARLLLSDPDLLILDEPTNHLDIAAVEWLESYLRLWKGAALIVSHDRYFLDQVVDHIWEMYNHGLEFYRGNYSAYVQQRQERWDLRQEIFESEMERLLKEFDYIKRNMEGGSVTQAIGRLRRLSRQVEAIEILGFEAVVGKQWLEISHQVLISPHMMGVDEIERRIHALRKPRPRPHQLHLHLKTNFRSGDLVLRTRDLAIGYRDEGKPLFRAPDLLLKRGECAALIGPNGAGKTTFLKTLLEKMPPLEGEVILGASLQIGYFAQAHEDLHPERTLVEEIDAVAPQMLLSEIRNYLARFLFTGEEVFKKVAVLSGGERGRLALAKLSLSGANLLLLDEPSNHLDIPSQEILQSVLSDFAGTILLVSHDRYLIDALATQVWEIIPGQVLLQTFDGTYSQYRAYLEAQRLAAEAQARQAASRLAPSRTSAPSHPSASPYTEHRRRLRLQEVEDQITALEQQLALLSRQLETPPADPALVQRLGSDYVRAQSALDALMAEWENLLSS